LYISMLTLSENANMNYVAEVVQINNLKKHPNADRLMIAMINFQPVIVWLNTKVWDIWIFVQVESQINDSFLSYNSMYSSNLLNRDTTISWYIGKSGRVKATKLRWSYSMGLFITVEDFEDYYWERVSWYALWTQFDTTDKWLFIKKYEVPVKVWTQSSRQWQKPVQDRLVDNQVKLHVDTDNLRRNMYQLSLSDIIGITYKYHWTSATFQHVLVKKKLNLIEKALLFLWVDINTTEYDLVYTSRKVVKNKAYETSKLWFYDSDPRAETANEIKDKVPRGYCIYWEIVGFQSTGASIQKWYDYWCDQWEKKLIVYRVTLTNADGIVYNLNTYDAKKRCDDHDLEFAEIEFYWTIKSLLAKHDISETEHRQENLLLKLEEIYNEKDCHICKVTAPEEGIVLRKERHDVFEAYKLKSFRFLEKETQMLDEEETENEVTELTKQL